MNEEFSQLAEESIQLELNVAKLYQIFRSTFPDDASFWNDLILEEDRHAALIQSLKDTIEPAGILIDTLLSESIQEIKDANNKIISLITKYKDTPPSREEAFRTALKLEQSAGEIHFQKFMEKESGSEFEKIFQKLNSYDKDHAMRIREYMESHGIALQE